MIIKKPQETVSIKPSVSAQNAQSGFPITFDVITQGDIESVRWNFGDGTPMIDGESVVHIFQNPGDYSIIARVAYASGVEKTETILYQVK